MFIYLQSSHPTECTSRCTIANSGCVHLGNATATCSTLLHLVLPCHVLSLVPCLVFILLYLVLSCLVLSCVALLCLVLSFLVLSCLVLSFLVLSCLLLSFLVCFVRPCLCSHECFDAVLLPQSYWYPNLLEGADSSSGKAVQRQGVPFQ